MSTEAHKRASMKWAKENYHQVALTMPNDYYANVFVPFVKSHGYTMRGFILEAIDHYMKYINRKEGDA